jgi:hypothetical protein
MCTEEEAAESSKEWLVTARLLAMSNFSRFRQDLDSTDLRISATSEGGKFGGNLKLTSNDAMAGMLSLLRRSP